jgi:hypothetical protein
MREEDLPREAVTGLIRSLERGLALDGGGCTRAELHAVVEEARVVSLTDGQLMALEPERGVVSLEGPMFPVLRRFVDACAVGGVDVRSLDCSFVARGAGWRHLLLAESREEHRALLAALAPFEREIAAAALRCVAGEGWRRLRIWRALGQGDRLAVIGGQDREVTPAPAEVSAALDALAAAFLAHDRRLASAEVEVNVEVDVDVDGEAGDAPELTVDHVYRLLPPSLRS